MTKLSTFDLSPLYRNSIGIDRLMSHMVQQLEGSEGSKNYPPYNIINVDEHNYLIELAVAGFGKDDISITEHDGTLEISGEKVETEEENEKNYAHKGISARRFTRSFNLADYVVVKGAGMQDGILTLSLERIVPEEMKPKTIAIDYKS